MFRLCLGDVLVEWRCLGHVFSGVSVVFLWCLGRVYVVCR